MTLAFIDRFEIHTHAFTLAACRHILDLIRVELRESHIPGLGKWGVGVRNTDYLVSLILLSFAPKEPFLPLETENN